MKFKKYRIREWWYGGETTDTEYELPVLTWLKDEIGDSTKYEGSYNYVAIVLKDQNIENWVETMADTVCSPASFFDLGEYYMVYMPNVLDIDGKFELTQKIVYPVTSILRFDKKHNEFIDVVCPLEYVGGGKCVAKIWSITHDGVEEPCYERRLIKISDFDIWNQLYIYSINSPKVDLYKKCVIDLIETGSCNINYYYAQELSRKIMTNIKTMTDDEFKALLDEYRLAVYGEKVQPSDKYLLDKFE